jgi:hypothetical protein
MRFSGQVISWDDIQEISSSEGTGKVELGHRPVNSSTPKPRDGEAQVAPQYGSTTKPSSSSNSQKY